MPGPEQKTLLIIDDEKSVRKSFVASLEDHHYHVLEASNGREGLAILQEVVPDLVLVDLRMPEVNGFFVLSYMKTEMPDVPVIVVSGIGVIEEALLAIRQGAWDYLMKPVADMEILIHSVEKALERARLIQENRCYSAHLEELVSERTEALEATASALKESEERLKLALEAANDALWDIDPEKGAIYLSPKWYEMMGYVEGRFELSPSHLMELVHPEDEKSVNHFMKRLLKTPDPLATEFRMKKQDGVYIWLLFRGKTVQWTPSGRSKRIIATTQDITSRKITEESIRALESQIHQAQKLEAIGTLASGITHDFNNILSSIIGYAELAEDALPEKSPVKKDLHEVVKAAERASDLVRQILSFSRQQKTEYMPIDTGSIIKEAMKMLRASIPSTIEFKTNIGPLGGAVFADPTQIYQIIMNLCTNACHAMEGGMGAIEVTLESLGPAPSQGILSSRLKPDRKYQRLTVRDNGCGMDRVTSGRIFDPFFTTKEKGKGTGLGLATIKNIVKDLEGDILFESQPGKGSIFCIYLPEIEEKAAPDVKKSSPIPFGNGEHLLLVDDEKVILGFEETMIRRLNYHVTALSRSSDALARFRSEPDLFDLVITDLTMPEMTGIKLAEEIHALRPETPVILTTGFSDMDVSERFADYGFAGLLHKPFTRREIAEAIHQEMQKRSS
jgi:PAS domain S-box-containing protein